MTSRPCGPCQACCIEPEITELDKPAGQRCEHLSMLQGCSAYGERPPVCWRYQCLWSRPEWDVPADLRPDLCGVLLAPAPGGIDAEIVAQGLDVSNRSRAMNAIRWACSRGSVAVVGEHDGKGGVPLMMLGRTE